MRHRIVSSLSMIVRRVLSLAVRTVITTLVFGTCLMITLRYMGVPVPSAYDIFHHFDSLSELARILS